MTKFVFKHALYLWVITAILLFVGLRAAGQLPVQLLPDIRKPEITIINPWPAAAPEELETRLVAPMEEALAYVNGVIETASVIDPGVAFTTLTFGPGTDMQQAYIDVVNRLNQQRNRPPSALEPQIINAATTNDATVATLLLYSQQNTGFDRTALTRAYTEVVHQQLLKIPGIANLDVSFNPTQKRLEIEFDPITLARLELTLDDMLLALRGANNRPAGSMALGSRAYAVRYNGRLDLQELQGLLIAQRHGRNIYLRDIATITSRYERSDGQAYIRGQQAFYIGINPANNANSLEVVTAVKDVIKQLNNTELAQRHLKISLGRDESANVGRAIDQVKSNLLLGMLLATAVLLLFLRRWQLIAVIFCTVPVAVILTLALMQLTGRSLNVISLAGIALSTGLILDAAIIAVDNILRLRQQGKGVEQSVITGLRQVRGALCLSVISSILIFAPVLLIQTQESQLFEDLALTVAASLIASLIISLTLLPLAVRHLLGNIPASETQSPLLALLANRFSAISEHRPLAFVVLLLLIVVPLPLSYALLPATDVLPDAKDSSISSYFGYTEAYNFQSIDKEVISPLTKSLEQHIASGKAPHIKEYFIATSLTGGVMAFYPQDSDELPALIEFLDEHIYANIPTLETYTEITPLLHYALPGSRKMLVDIQGTDLATLEAAAHEAIDVVEQQYPEAAVQPTGVLGSSYPQLKFLPDDQQLMALGSNRHFLGNLIEALNEGLYINEYFDGNQSTPLYLKGPAVHDVNDLLNTPVFIPGHDLTPLRQLTHSEYALGPESISRINKQLTVTLEIHPPEGQPLATFITDFKQTVQPTLDTALGDSGFIAYRGSANRLDTLLGEMFRHFGFAALVLLLLMLSLFRSIGGALMVMLSLPVAILGGVIALRLLNLHSFQSLDVITMIGFIILIGLVVNNAILLVSQYQQSCQLGKTLRQTLQHALGIRARPIYMSTLTSILGMLPLLVIPGTGAEIYRGLAAVIIGGMCFSGLFVLPLMAAMFSLWPRPAEVTTVSETASNPV